MTPSWLGAIPALQVAIVAAAREAIGVCEDPLGSNTSPEIDDYLRRLGVPLKSPWCAAALADWFDTAGAARPIGSQASSCDAWMKWAKEHQLWTPNAQPGYAVIYGKKQSTGDDAQHCGIILRVRPLPLSIEGNRGFGAATPEGVAVDAGPVSAGWVLGYIRPVAA